MGRGGLTRVVVSVSLPPELFERVKREAGRRGVKVSVFVRRALEAYLGEEGEESAGPAPLEEPRETLEETIRDLRETAREVRRRIEELEARLRGEGGEGT